MVKCEITRVGEDDLILVTGGTKPHIGAIVLCTWDGIQAHVVSHGLPHHKEEKLYIELAQLWCTTFKKNVVLTGGIHIDNATKEDIEMLVNKTWESFFLLMANNKVSIIK
ncbi:hypothetical protein [Evansella cellulosilytica]|uniref:Prenylated flavin chaperone LpdD-like domain-containing protein n=1 Tax=Evansella cellulosilytica (strain ATCC 21833 / DSM 2522 / FERM P-1141 / JCM 9156 / N-4) TaxID=649639 RepID=E6TXX6_EVAC2|nr:hypothetical protein [Evansella cellulosilytica]ADU31189.1 hypothetical protein Bcell_2938 [Evansella cellulosilytica DSM 2522]